MRGTARSGRIRHGAMGAAVAIGCVIASVAAESVPGPGRIRAMTLAMDIERLAPGALDLDRWLVIESELERADDGYRARVRPIVDRLETMASAQSWLNWPWLKPREVRHGMDESLDAQWAVDAEFFDASMRRLEQLRAQGEGGARDAEVRRAMQRLRERRARQIHPPWPLLDAAPAELSSIADRVLGGAELSEATRREVEGLLEAWEAQAASSWSAQRLLRRAAFDRLEERLTELGVDLRSPDGPGAAWMTGAFDAWEEVSVPLAAATRDLLELDRRTIAAIAAKLPAEMAGTWRDGATSRAYRVSGQDNRAFAGDDLTRALRLKGLSAERRERVRALHARWSREDADLVTAWCAAHAADAPPYCPLTHAHWGPDGRYGRFDERRRELDHARIALGDAAVSELRGILGGEASILDAGVFDTDPRLEPTDPAPPTPFWRDATDGWIDPGCAVLFSHPSARGWFDPGPMPKDEWEAIVRWLDLGPVASELLLVLHTDRAEEFAAALDLGAERSGWWFEHGRYEYRPSVAAGILARSIERERALERWDDEWRDAALAAAPDDAARRRVRLAAAAREMHRRLEPLSNAASSDSLDRRGSAPLPMSLLAACLLSASKAAATDEAIAARRREDELLASIDDDLAALLPLAGMRIDAARESFHRQVQLADEAMWRSDLRSEVERQRWNLRSVDAPARAALAEAQEALADRLRTRAAAGDELAGRAVRCWDGAAFPMVLRADPEVTPRLRRDAATEAPAGAAFEALRRWHADRDDALVRRARALCVRVDAEIEPASAGDRLLRADEELRSIADQRLELNDRAEIRRRLLRRQAGMESPLSASPGR